MTEFITMAQAASMLPTKPHPSAVWRWGRRGLKTIGGERIRLRIYKAGRAVLTTEGDLRQFMTAVADADARHFERIESVPIEPTPARGERTEGERLAAAQAAAARVRG